MSHETQFIDHAGAMLAKDRLGELSGAWRLLVFAV